MGKKRGHTGFWLNVDDEPVHVLGDPEMSQETANAISEVVRAVREQYGPEGSGWQGWPGPYARMVEWFEAKLNMVEVRYGDYR
ncbi:MAG: hypothetical protein ABI690_13430 [Chloroflexota bacterium]